MQRPWMQSPRCSSSVFEQSLGHDLTLQPRPEYPGCRVCVRACVRVCVSLGVSVVCVRVCACAHVYACMCVRVCVVCMCVRVCL